MRPNSPTFGQTPAKVHVKCPGLLTLSSSNKKKNISKCYQKASKNTLIPIRFTHGLVKRESFIKFAVNVFQYLLYDNDVIPIPFQYFDRIVASQTESSLATAKESQVKRMNLLSTMFGSLNDVFKLLCQLFDESLEHTQIAMCFGDSVRFAKEIFILDFSKLNLYSTFAEINTNHHASSTRLLRLEDIIRMFYQKLLNEVLEEGAPSSKESSGSKSKATSVIFMVKINSKDIEKFESFTNSKRNDENSPANFPYFDRLGCTITKTTTFKLSHTPKQPVVFEIFNADDYPVEEIIEEKLLDEDEEKLTKRTLATLNESNESIGSNSGEQLTPEQQQQLQLQVDEVPEKKEPSTEPEFIWVQINAPIRCFSKM